jgi:hypothetical protein
MSNLAGPTGLEPARVGFGVHGQINSLVFYQLNYGPALVRGLHGRRDLHPHPRCAITGILKLG